MHRLKQIGELFIQNRWILCQGIFGIYMIILSVMDLKKKKLDLRFLLSGFLIAAAGCLCERDTPPVLLAAGGGTGLVFLIISRVTKEAFGYGDSILIMVTGCLIGFWNLLSVLMAAFFMAAMFSMFLLTVRHFSRKAVFPFVPFLAAGYIGGMIIGIY